MELKVIRHKTSKEFFEGFYTDEQVGSYAYQLERMFEQGSAVEGDYFVVFDKEKPLLSLEIYRNNTRRILEKMPMIAIGTKVDSKGYIKGLSLIFDHLSEDMVYGYTQKRLEISLKEDYEFYSEFKEILHKCGYKAIVKAINYTIDPNINYNFELENYSSKKLIEYEIENRYDLISCSTDQELHVDLPIERLYIDLIEEGYDSERLWETVDIEGEMIGYLLPIYTNGLKNSIELIDYGLKVKDSERSFYEVAIYRMIEIAKNNDIEDLTININSSDTQFVNLANKLNLIKNHITEKFLKL